MGGLDEREHALEGVEGGGSGVLVWEWERGVGVVMLDEEGREMSGRLGLGRNEGSSRPRLQLCRRLCTPSSLTPPPLPLFLPTLPLPPFASSHLPLPTPHTPSHVLAAHRPPPPSTPGPRPGPCRCSSLTAGACSTCLELLVFGGGGVGLGSRWREVRGRIGVRSEVASRRRWESG